MRVNRHGFPVFNNQAQAFECLKTHPEFHALVAREIPDHENPKAKREFWAIEWNRFYEVYARELVPAQRHFHELVREGAQCHLYMDVEMERSPNGQARMNDGSRMLDALLQLCIAKLHEKRILREENACTSSSSSSSSSTEYHSDLRVMTLDSSASYKLSLHYILRIRGTAWASNRACGAFMQELYTSILESEARAARKLLGKGEEAEAPLDELEQRKLVSEALRDPAALERVLGRPSLFVFTQSSPELASFMVDMQVYSKNRTFRMYQSTKPGARLRFLRTAEEIAADSYVPEERVFFQSLVTFFYDQGARVTQVLREDRFAAPCTRKRKSSASDKSRKRVCDSSVSDEFRALIEYFENSLGHPVDRARISVSSQHGTVLFPTFSRRCSILESRTRGRVAQHRGNHIFFVVDMLRGEIRARCNDQDCKLYIRKRMSEFSTPLPSEYLPRVHASVEKLWGSGDTSDQSVMQDLFN